MIVLGSEKRQLSNTLNQISFIEIASGAVRCKEGREWLFEKCIMVFYGFAELVHPAWHGIFCVHYMARFTLR